MRLFTIIFLLSIGLTSFAQSSKNKMSRAEYISKYKDDAIREMHRTGVPASITLAQGLLESGNGNSALAREANNHFGIKCHGWSGKSYHQDDDRRDECFRKYKNVLESYHDHSEFLLKSRYSDLFKLKTTDYKGWAHGLKRAGYATNPRYPQLLISIIEDNNLDKYDDKNGRRLAETPKKDSENHRNEKAKHAIKNVKTKDNGNGRVKIHENNIRFIVVQNGDNFDRIANEFNMGLWQLYKYNDLDKDDKLEEGEILFLQPKRNRAKEDFHTVVAGESMRDISQRYGVKLKKLYRKNRMDRGSEPKVGQKLSLRRNKR